MEYHFRRTNKLKYKKKKIQFSNLRMVSDSKLDVILRGQNSKFLEKKGIFIQNKVLITLHQKLIKLKLLLI